MQIHCILRKEPFLPDIWIREETLQSKPYYWDRLMTIDLWLDLFSADFLLMGGLHDLTIPQFHNSTIPQLNNSTD